MLNSYILLLPSFVCLFWAIPLALRKPKTPPQRILAFVAMLGTIYFFIDANYVTPNADYNTLVLLDIIGPFMTLLLFPTVLQYMDSLAKIKRHNRITTISYIPAFFMFGASLVIYAMMGIRRAGEYIAAYDRIGGHPEGYDDRIFYLHDYVSMNLYNCLMLIWIAVLLSLLILFLVRNDFMFPDIFKFFHKNRQSSSLNIQAGLFLIFFAICIVRILLGRSWLMSHPVASGVFSAAIATVILFLFYIGLWFEGTKVSLVDLRAPGDRRIVKDTFQDIGSADEIVSSFRQGKGDLPKRFEKYMNDEKAYLKPDISLEMAAKALHTNRTYVSVVLKDVYNMTFREYVGQKRLEAAKIMLLQDPDATLVYIAAACGYSSDSQMIKKFNEIVGESPRSWQKKQQEIT